MLNDLALISPLLIVAIMGLVALLIAVFTPRDSAKGWLGYVTIFGYVLAFAALVWLWDAAPAVFESQFANSLTLDHFGIAMCGIILIGAIFMTLNAVDYLPAQNADHGEYYALVAFSTLGMMALVLAADLLTFFIALELMSISIYILAGFKRQSRFSTEAAMKYFILGAFASAILLLGISMAYGATGEITLRGIGSQIANPGENFSMELASLSMVLLIVAFFFKVAAAPFHMWTPDVYEGSPSSVSGFMAVGVKTAAFGGFARLLLTAFGDESMRSGEVPWESIIAIIAVISMFAGNLMALGQRNLKRMLAYSAVAHTGYILMALLVTPPAEQGGVYNALGGGMIFYLLGYTLANCVAFGVAAAVSDNDVEDINDVAYAGLAKKSPLLALALAISMLSLLGIPITAGFMGKLTIFEEVLSTGGGEHLWLIIVAVVNSIISAWYYLRVIMVSYMSDEATNRPIQLIKSKPLMASVTLATIATIAVGLMPSKAMKATERAGHSLVETTHPTVLNRTVKIDLQREASPRPPRAKP
jgi:NADH-quinone oxidoreductase subunit N